MVFSRNSETESITDYIPSQHNAEKIKKIGKTSDHLRKKLFAFKKHYNSEIFIWKV